MEEGGGDSAEWQTFQILSTLVSTEQNLVTQWEGAALLSLDNLLACGVSSSFPPLTPAQNQGWLPTLSSHGEHQSIRG